MSDDQDTMDEWAAALAEAEGTDYSPEVKVTELDELDDYHMRACESEAEWYEEVDNFDRNATPPF